jgi:endoglucanase
MQRSTIAALAIALVIVVLAVVVIADRSGDVKAKPPTGSPSQLTTDSANHFFAKYLDADGRVVRHDQGDDTVSEGQSYGLLIAVGVGDKAKFDSIWNWTKSNLLQKNGLLAWRWADGKVADPQGATDADLDAAHALDLASLRFNDSSYADQARSLAKAVLDLEVFYDHNGTPVLMAGPWATSAPYFVDPSYDSPRSEQDLAKIVPDARWSMIEKREQTLMNDLLGTGNGISLPPDWAILDPSGSVKASGPPGSPNDTPKYSYDALRVPIRLADSCDATDRATAAKFWPILSRHSSTESAATYSLNGTVIDKSPSAPGAVSAAAAAYAAGQSNQVTQLLNQADQIETQHSTYYGAAWAALGRIMFTTNWLGTC